MHGLVTFEEEGGGAGGDDGPARHVDPRCRRPHTGRASPYGIYQGEGISGLVWVALLGWPLLLLVAPSLPAPWPRPAFVHPGCGGRARLFSGVLLDTRHMVSPFFIFFISPPPGELVRPPSAWRGSTSGEGRFPCTVSTCKSGSPLCPAEGGRADSYQSIDRPW